jgi:hypothetical protein
MMTDLRDNRGTKIEVGQKVAYNLSGQVSLGEIVNIVPGDPNNYYKRCVIEVRPLLKNDLKFHAKPSKVRSPFNVLVLLDNET